jgi:hypothetical protein
MLCKACGAAMTLMNVDRDDTLTILGSEHHTLKCPDCDSVSWHLVFIRHGRESDNPPMPAHAAHPVAPPSNPQAAHTSLFKRLAAKLRGSWEVTFSKRSVATKASQSVIG